MKPFGPRAATLLPDGRLSVRLVGVMLDEESFNTMKAKAPKAAADTRRRAREEVS